jgi:integrase/recombinase XerD
MSTTRRQGWGELTSEFLRMLAIERGLSANSLESYAFDLADLRRFCESKYLAPAELDARVIVEWLESTMGRGAGHASRRRYYSCVRNFSTYLVRLGILKSNGASVLKLRPGVRPLPRVPSRELLEVLLRSIDPKSGDSRDARDHLMITLAARCGLRVSELVSIQAGQFDAGQGILHVRGKGGKERMIPVPDNLIRAFRQAIARADPGNGSRIFVTRRFRKPMTRQGFNKLLHERCDAAKVPRINPHSLRHAYATNLSEGGADPIAIKELLGHSDISTTQIYAHLSTKHLREVYRQFHPRA